LPISADGLYWLLLGIGAAIGLRLVVETRSSRGATAAAWCAGLFYLAAGLNQIGVIQASSHDVNGLFAGMTLLTGHFLLTMSLVIYARFVFLDAQGLLDQRTVKVERPGRRRATSKPKAKVTKGNEPATIGGEPSTSTGNPGKSAGREPAPRQTKAPWSRTEAAKEKTQEVATPKTATTEETAPATLKMSRSERRRRRKQKHRERRAA
jgi:hypothetical protein